MTTKITKEEWASQDWKGKSNAEIGEALGCSPQAASQQRKNGGYPSYEKAYPQPVVGDSIRAIAGKRIRILRNGAGLTMAALGGKIQAAIGAGKWPRSSVHAVENGSPSYGRRLTLDSLMAFAMVLGVTPADLIRDPKQGGWTSPGEGSLKSLSLKSSKPSFREIIGGNIRRWREYHGWDEKALADTMVAKGFGSWTPTSICGVEAGKYGAGVHGIHLDSLGQFADVLGVYTSDLCRLPGQRQLHE